MGRTCIAECHALLDQDILGARLEFGLELGAGVDQRTDRHPPLIVPLTNANIKYIATTTTAVTMRLRNWFLWSSIGMHHRLFVLILALCKKKVPHNK